MYNAQVDVYRLEKVANVTKYETTAYKRLRAYIEPAGVNPVVPIDASIGNPMNIHINSTEQLGLKEGDKLVDINNTSQEYIIISSINEYHETPNTYAYEFVTYQKKS